MNNPFADENYELDYGLKGKDIELREMPKGKARPESPPQNPALAITAASSYRDLEFEPIAPRQQNNSAKATYYFDKSLERLKTAGFERHPLPREAFALIIDGLEGKLNAPEQAIKQDMLASYGEWLSLVVKPQGGLLHCYERPQNVVWVQASNAYDCSRLTSPHPIKTFPLNGLKLRDYNPIKDIAAKSPDLVTYIWSRPLNQLPAEIQNNAGLWIPGENTAWPVARDDCSNGCNVSGGNWASRGVRRAQKNSSGNRGP